LTSSSRQCPAPMDWKDRPQRTFPRLHRKIRAGRSLWNLSQRLWDHLPGVWRQSLRMRGSDTGQSVGGNKFLV